MREIDIQTKMGPYTKVNMRNYINNYFIRKDRYFMFNRFNYVYLFSK